MKTLPLPTLWKIITALMIAGIAEGATYTWTGTAGDGDWSNPTNWDGNSVPVDTDASQGLTFDNPASVIIFSGATLPSSNIPDLGGVNNNNGVTPALDLRSGGTLNMTLNGLIGGVVTRPSTSRTVFTVGDGSGAEVILNVALTGDNLNRDPSGHTHNYRVNSEGVLNFDSLLDFSNTPADRWSTFTIDGGAVNVAGPVRDLTASVNNFVDFISANGTFTAAYGNDFADITAVLNEVQAGGASFRSSASLTLTATDNGNGTFTVSAPEGGVTGSYTWTGGTDSDWNNPDNWSENIIPAVDSNGSVFGQGNSIAIQNGTYLPVTNVPSFANSAAPADGAPAFILAEGASLSMTAFSANPVLSAENSTAVAVGAGGQLILSAPGGAGNFTFARNAGTQTFDLQGTLTIAADSLYLGYQAGHVSGIVVDGGTFQFNGTSLYGTQTISGDFSALRSQVVLSNGSSFSAPNAALSNTIGSDAGDPTLVFDIQDANSSVTLSYGGDFADTAAVESVFGLVFTSSTLGDGYLVATDNGSTFTVSASPPEVFGTYNWIGNVDDDWNNPANWDAGGVPAVNLDGSVFDEGTLIAITGTGTFQPVTNVPTFSVALTPAEGCPRFIVGSGGSLSIDAFGTSHAYIASQNLDAVTIIAGGSLTWNGSTNVYLGYNPGNQVYNIEGTFTINVPSLNMGWQAGNNTTVNLDGGTLHFTGSTIFSTRSYNGDFIVSHNRVNLDNGASFLAPSAVMRNTDGDVNPEYDPPLVFDIRDTASSVTFKFGRYAFYDLWAVTADFGTTFISSTGLSLDAVDNGNGTCTITAFEPVITTDPIAITSPMTRAVYQRNATNSASITIEGTYTGSLDSVDVIVTPMTGFAGEAIERTALDSNPQNGLYSGELSVKGGWYQIEVIGVLTGSDVSSAILERVGVGEVFLTCGQSNSANYGSERQTPSDDRVSTYNLDEWVQAADPQPIATGDQGSPWPAFGDKLVEYLDVPVAILSVGIGSTSVESWVPGGVNYDRIKNVLAFLGPNGCRAVLWHQGETDSIQGTSTLTYKERLQSIIAQSRIDCGYDIPWGVAIASWHPSSTEANQANISAGQLAVISEDDLVFKGPETDEFHIIYESGVHFNTPGLTEHGHQWAGSVRQWIFPKPLARVDLKIIEATPGAIEIEFLAESNVTYQIQSADTLSADPAIWQDEGDWIHESTDTLINFIYPWSVESRRFFRIEMPYTDY